MRDTVTAAAPPRNSWKLTLALATLLFVLILALSAVPAIRESELRIADAYFRLAPRPARASPVLLVLIDDESLRQYGRWPWPRELLGKMIRNLAQAGPQVIGLDILLSEPQSPSADRSLQEFLSAVPTIIVDKIGSYSGGPRWVEPLPEFSRAARAVGHAQAVLDLDSVCRRFPARELTLDGSRWAFAVEVARQALPQQASDFVQSYGLRFDDDAGRVTTADPVLVPIAYRRGGFETISAAAVLQGRALDTVRGRIVLAGFGTAEIGDRISTPLAAEFPTPGVEVHAQILDSILAGRKLHEVPLWARILLLLGTCVVVIALFRQQRGWLAVVLLIAIGAGVYGGAFLLFVSVSQIIPPGQMLLAILIGPLLAFTADFAIVERSVRHQLHELQRWLTQRRREGSAADAGDLSWRLSLLQRLQAELGSLYELHKTLLETTQDAIIIFDHRGKCLLHNRAFSAVCKSDAGFNLQRLQDLMNSKDDAPLSPTAKGGVEGEAYLDKELYAVRIAPMPSTTLAPGGGTIVTLSSLRTRLERDRARSEALGFITHELRTPLVAIQNFAELMMQYPAARASANAPATIFRESKRLLALVHSYLDVLRLDAGARPVRSDPVQLDEIVSQVFEILQPLAAANDMRLEFLGIALSIIGDGPLLSGALLNLVSNALKYGKPGTQISVRCWRSGEQVILSVHNHGEPLAPEEAPRVFESFQRTSAMETAVPGWGLGLAFVRRIAEKHGGSVWVESSSTGTLFGIRLPARALARTGAA